MSIEIKAPQFPESVADGTVATWHKKVGEAVKRDELIVDIETDKVVLEVMAPADGTIKEILKDEGDIVESEAIIAIFAEGAVAESATEATKAAAIAEVSASDDEPLLSPAAKKLAEENNIDVATVKGTGKGGRVTKEDMLNAIESKKSAKASAATAPAPAAVEVPAGERIEKRVPMTRMRARIAERLLDASQN